MVTFSLWCLAVVDSPTNTACDPCGGVIYLFSHTKRHSHTKLRHSRVLDRVIPLVWLVVGFRLSLAADCPTVTACLSPTMLSRASFSITRRVAPRLMSTEAAAAVAVKLNFSLPHESIYNGVDVHSVILPGSAGEYGITANHVPYVAQLKPGVVQILHEEGTSEPEKYFVPGGFALTHEDSSTVRFLFRYTTIALIFLDRIVRTLWFRKLSN